jgi:hypothetical protein
LRGVAGIGRRKPPGCRTTKTGRFAGGSERLVLPDRMPGVFLGVLTDGLTKKETRQKSAAIRDALAAGFSSLPPRVHPFRTRRLFFMTLSPRRLLMTGAAGGFGEALRHRPGVRRWCSPAPTMSPVFIGRTKPSQRTTPPRPDGFYRLSKAFGKDLARLYFDRHGIETACIRIGSSFRAQRPVHAGHLAQRRRPAPRDHCLPDHADAGPQHCLWHVGQCYALMARLFALLPADPWPVS